MIASIQGGYKYGVDPRIVKLKKRKEHSLVERSIVQDPITKLSDKLKQKEAREKEETKKSLIVHMKRGLILKN